MLLCLLASLIGSEAGLTGALVYALHPCHTQLCVSTSKGPCFLPGSRSLGFPDWRLVGAGLVRLRGCASADLVLKATHAAEQSAWSAFMSSSAQDRVCGVAENTVLLPFQVVATS